MVQDSVDEPKYSNEISDKIRIIFITTIPKSFYQLRGQLRYIGSHGFDVHCISSPGPDLDAVVRRENAQIHPVLMHRSINPLFDVLSAIKIGLIILKLKPSIIHAGTPKGGFLGIVVSTLLGVPNRIYFSHGLRFINMKGWKRTILYLTEKIACTLATRIYCVSNSLREQYIKLNICTESKSYIPLNGSINGVDSSKRFNPENLQSERLKIRQKYGISEGSVVVGFVGRIARDKGFIELIEAWNRIKVKVSNLHLLIVGPFEPEDPIPLNVRNEIESELRITLAGSIPNPAPYYAAMDVYVLPSYREGLPTTLLEAASMKLPVVATRIPGSVDAVIDGNTGTLINVRDPISLANALLIYCENSDLRRKHGLNGRKRVVHDFNPKTTWNFMIKEFYSLMDNPPRDYSRL